MPLHITESEGIGLQPADGSIVDRAFMEDKDSEGRRAAGYPFNEGGESKL